MAGLVKVSAIHARLDRKKKRDEGTGVSSASDPVTVTFNESFFSILKIGVTANANGGTPESMNPIYDFDGSTVNPTSFDVYIFDKDGAQIAAAFSWEATGI